MVGTTTCPHHPSTSTPLQDPHSGGHHRLWRARPPQSPPKCSIMAEHTSIITWVTVDCTHWSTCVASNLHTELLEDILASQTISI